MKRFALIILLLLSFGVVLSHADPESQADGAAQVQAENVSPDSTVSERVPPEQVHIKDVNSYVSRWLATVDETMPEGWLTRSFMDIQVWRYLAFGVLLLLTLGMGAVLRWFLEVRIMRLASRTKWDVDDLFFTAAGRPARLLFVAMGLYLSLMVILVGAVPASVVVWWSRLSFAVAAGAVFWYLYRLVDLLDHYLRRLSQRTDNDLDDAIVDVVRKSVRIFILGVAFIYIGNNVLDWDITAVLASAGVLGLAVAFAAQDTIANFFGTIMLLLDRPFKVGDRIILEGAEGPVEAIGFRSTRIRTMAGNQVSIPNKVAADAMIENVARRPHIKRQTVIGVTYDTPFAKVQKAVEIIRDVLKDHRGMDPEFPPRVYFHEFGDCSLNISVTTWFHPGDHWEHMAWCEEVNFEIMRRFEAEDIEFAFPTSTVYLAHDAKRPLTIQTVSGNQPGQTLS